MKQVELYAKVRYAVRIEGLSERAAARRFGIDPRTVAKMLAFSVPPGYRRTKPPLWPKLDAVIAVIERILAEDKGRPKKQQHTAKRIFERLRDEHGFTGGITIVKDYVAGWRQRAQEMFVPLAHPPGHAQVDFGEALAVIGGVERKIHFFAFDLPHSDACFVMAYPQERTEAFCDGHVQAFTFFGGVPRSILYDNTKIAVARILGDGKRQRTQTFAELQSHYLFQDRFGRPGRGNDKGKVEGLVGFARRNFLVPIPVFDSFAALNEHLLACCRKRMSDRLRGHAETIGERLQRDLAALQRPLPPPYDACEKVPTTVSSLEIEDIFPGLGRRVFNLNARKISQPGNHAHRMLLVFEDITERKQRERDALSLTNEISHRIKNNLQIIVGLIAYEARWTAKPCVQGYKAMQARIGAIAQLYDLISQSSRGRSVAVDAYLREIAKTMSAGLLGHTSGITIDVKAEPLEIDPDRAVPFGLLVNELATNAIKHAFPDGAGRVVLSVEQVGDQIELTVADDGVGMKDKDNAKTPEKRGSDYVAIFVRQLGGTIVPSGSQGAGTIVRIRLPLLLVTPGGAERVAA